MICGVFHLQDGGDHALFSLLPSLIHIKGEQGRAVEWLDTTLKFMSSEIGAARPGSDTIVGRLTDILFIQSVRAWIDSQGNGGCGWLTALNDPQIGAALGQIHRVPGQPWSVEALADRVGMSRSAFSARFSSLLGEPPIRYVTRWRMRLASNWLRDTDISLTAISERLGYDSDGSFERAFKREVGVAPGAYRRRVRTKARGAEAFSTQRAA